MREEGRRKYCQPHQVHLGAQEDLGAIFSMGGHVQLLIGDPFQELPDSWSHINLIEIEMLQSGVTGSHFQMP